MADPEPQTPIPDRPLLYAALLWSQAEAADALKDVLAQINEDHPKAYLAHLTSGFILIVAESEQLNTYCREHAVSKARP